MKNIFLKPELVLPLLLFPYGASAIPAPHARAGTGWAETMSATRVAVREFDAWEKGVRAELGIDRLQFGPWLRWRTSNRDRVPEQGNFDWDPGVEAYVAATPRITAGQTVAGMKFEPCAWADGTVQRAERTRDRTCVEYFYREIRVPKARELELYLGFTHGMKLFLNGKLIARECEPPRPCQPGQSVIRIELNEGLNCLLLKFTDDYRQAHGSANYFHVLQHPRRASGPELLREIHARFPMESDWLLQDYGADLDPWFDQDGSYELERQWITRAAVESGTESGTVNRRLAELVAAGSAAADRAWLDLYVDVCTLRRSCRLQRMCARTPSVVFAKRHPVSPSFFAYTEGQSDAQNERHFRPGASLCLLTLTGTDCSVDTLLADPQGVIRDPEVSVDASRILFAWKKSDRDDDYHLYEMAWPSRDIRQLTEGPGFSDYEPAYLPNGDIIFSSTRCVQTVDCWWTEVSNLYTCDADGHFLRRLGFDQVHTISPSVLEDGSVVYTRWDYNDRGQIFPQGLFRMNPDGTGQTEFYGNNSYFPTTLSHARGIPGTQKVLAVAMGHHTWQAGKLVEIDPAKGRQEESGVTMLAPRRAADPVRIDTYGQSGELFRHPYPLTPKEFLVTYVPAELNRGRGSVFGLYWMDENGRRELLAFDAALSANNPVPLVPRIVPHERPSIVDYRKNEGIYYLQDIYRGPGLAGIERGTVRRLRVIALEYRAAGVQNNGNRGPAGGALVSTPISIDNGAWDVKKVLGDATVYEDGSACFRVPVRTPVYFQALDARGFAVQTMRSWTTLMPGEAFSCVGCHEHKNETPSSSHSLSLAMRKGPETLAPFYGEPRGFSFIREIQPILDRHCVRCHTMDGGDADNIIHPSASHCQSGDTASALCDGSLPADSNDHSIRRFTWWNHLGTREWVQYDFSSPRTIGASRVYWFDDQPRGGRCRLPKQWKLQCRVGEEWQDIAAEGAYGIEKDTFNTVAFPSIKTSSLRMEVELQPELSGGILEWQIAANAEEFPDTCRSRLNLSGRRQPGRGGRAWSESYLSLTNHGNGSEWVNWISAQSIPAMLPPYHKGAATSKLLSHLSAGHKQVSLSQEEMDKLACWIDLLVPYCGDYLEATAWSPEELAKYEHFARKRRNMEEIEARSIESLVRQAAGPH